MKKLILVALLLMLFAKPTLAEDTSDPTWDIPYPFQTHVLNHDHQYVDRYYDREDPIGGGWDVTVVKTDNKVVEKVDIQTKYDCRNQELSFFVVGQSDASGVISGICKGIGKFFGWVK